MSCDFGIFVNSTCLCFNGYTNSNGFIFVNDCAVQQYKDMNLTIVYIVCYGLYFLTIGYFHKKYYVKQENPPRIEGKEITSAGLRGLMIVSALWIIENSLNITFGQYSESTKILFWIAFLFQTSWEIRISYKFTAFYHDMKKYETQQIIEFIVFWIIGISMIAATVIGLYYSIVFNSIASQTYVQLTIASSVWIISNFMLMYVTRFTIKTLEPYDGDSKIEKFTTNTNSILWLTNIRLLSLIATIVFAFLSEYDNPSFTSYAIFMYFISNVFVLSYAFVII